MLQAAVQQLSQAQAVAMVHEPENVHDPNAVRVETLGGRPLRS